MRYAVPIETNFARYLSILVSVALYYILSTYLNYILWNMDKNAPLRKKIQQKSLNFPNTPRSIRSQHLAHVGMIKVLFISSMPSRRFLHVKKYPTSLRNVGGSIQMHVGGSNQMHVGGSNQVQDVSEITHNETPIRSSSTTSRIVVKSLYDLYCVTLNPIKKKINFFTILFFNLFIYMYLYETNVLKIVF
jgi:hypothetical protein